MEPLEPGGNRRQQERRRLPQYAFVKIPNRKLMSCVVGNLSPSGAFLEFEREQPLESSFQLITNTERGTLDCEVVRRNTFGIGVRFCQPEIQ